MSFGGRIKNLTGYIKPAGVKAVFGLLTQDWRQPWLETVGGLDFGSAAPADVLPWLTYGAINYIEANQKEIDNVLEFGAGASTVWLSNFAKKIVSLERNEQWLEKVRTVIEKAGITSIEMHAVKGFTYSREDIEKLSAQKRNEESDRYLKYIQHEPNSYDLILIDDIFRVELIEKAGYLLKPGGMMVLDDSERTTYERAFRIMHDRGWNSAHFHGPVPYTFREKQTSIFIKPSD